MDKLRDLNYYMKYGLTIVFRIHVNPCFTVFDVVLSSATLPAQVLAAQKFAQPQERMESVPHGFRGSCTP